MQVRVSKLRQVAIPVSDLGRSVRFYRDVVGIEHTADFDPPGLAFFRLGETRLLLERSMKPGPSLAVLYLDVPDIHKIHAELEELGIQFDSAPHLIHRDADGTFGPAGEEEWMAFFRDPDGNVLALASRVARGTAG